MSKLQKIVNKDRDENENDANLALDRTFFMDFFADDITKLHSSC